MAPIQLHVVDYLIMALYMGTAIGMGIYFSRNEKNSEDFLLGGRKIPFLAAGISYFMAMLSTYTLVMVPGEIYNYGLSMWVLNLTIPVLAIPAFLIFVRFYFKLQSFTPFEYLEYRYDAQVRLLVAILYGYSRAVYLGMVLFATSKVFEGCAGWPAWVTICLVGVVGTAYTVLGGMKAVIWVDVLQFFILVGGIGAAVVVLCMKIDGGFLGAITYSFEHGRGLDRFKEADFYLCSPYVRLSFWLLLLGRIMQPLVTAASDQITIQRLLSTSSYHNAFKAQLSSSLINIPFTMVIWFIGLAVFTYYQQNPDPRVTSGDTAFFTFVATRLPAPIPGMVMAAMLAAVMSTLDSGINSLSTVWLKEFHQKYWQKGLSDAAQVKVSRWATAGFGVFATLIGLLVAGSSEWMGQSVVEAHTIFSVFEVIVFPAFLFAVLSRRANSTLVWVLAALLWGMKTGVVIWYMLSKRAVQIWKPGQDMGFGGPISCYWFVLPLLLGAILLFWWWRKRQSSGKKCLVTLGVALFPWGFASAGIMWYLSSHYLIGDKPQELSFMWVGFPVTIAFLVFGVIGLMLSKVQPKEKYQGLTLSTVNSKLLEKQS